MIGEFNPTYSTNNIWRDENMEQCLTLDLEAIEADVAALETGKANTTHTHTNYATTSHTHTGYAAATHTHADKADLVNGVVSSSQIPSDIITYTKLANIMGTHYDMNATVTPGENYSSASGNATLVGNMLRVRFSADRNSAASGNINNETVATFAVSHGGKIKGGYAVTFNNATSGHVASMNVANVSCTETTLTFNITLTATAGETSSTNAYFALPVIIDVTKY